jgi:hypothetical protein
MESVSCSDGGFEPSNISFQLLFNMRVSQDRRQGRKRGFFLFSLERAGMAGCFFLRRKRNF